MCCVSARRLAVQETHAVSERNQKEEKLCWATYVAPTNIWAINSSVHSIAHYVKDSFSNCYVLYQDHSYNVHTFRIWWDCDYRFVLWLQGKLRSRSRASKCVLSSMATTTKSNHWNMCFPSQYARCQPCVGCSIHYHSGSTRWSA
jgi:hypothetical protein